MALIAAVIGLYAWSAAGATRRLPFQRLVLGAAACVFILRAAVLPVVLLIVPATREQLPPFEVATSILCFLIGMAFLPVVRKRVNHSSRVNAG